VVIVPGGNVACWAVVQKGEKKEGRKCFHVLGKTGDICAEPKEEGKEYAGNRSRKVEFLPPDKRLSLGHGGGLSKFKAPKMHWDVGYLLIPVRVPQGLTNRLHMAG